MNLPALVKFTILVVTMTALLLVSYRFLVRYTFIGRILNGPRDRPKVDQDASSGQNPLD